MLLIVANAWSYSQFFFSDSFFLILFYLYFFNAPQTKPMSINDTCAFVPRKCHRSNQFKIIKLQCVWNFCILIYWNFFLFHFFLIVFGEFFLPENRFAVFRLNQLKKFRCLGNWMLICFWQCHICDNLNLHLLLMVVLYVAETWYSNALITVMKCNSMVWLLIFPYSSLQAV